MQIIHHITMDMVQPQPMVSLDAVQGDGNTRQILLKLLENGKSWEVPADVTAAVAFRKADGTRGLYDTLPDGTKAVTVSGNTVAAVLAPQVLSRAGEVSATVVFHDGKLNQLAAFPFSIWVKENPAAGQALSNDYYSYSTMEEVGDAVDEALASLETEKQAFLAKAQEALQAVHDTATEDAPAIVCEAAGETVTVKDASDRLMKGLTICGNTVQNGTPTPENPVPLESAGAGGSICVTVAGKNLFDDVGWFESHGFAKQSDGSWSGILLNKPCWTNTARKEGAMYVTAIAKTDVTTVPLYFVAYYTDGTNDSSPVLKPTNGFTQLTLETNPDKTVDYIKWTWGSGGDFYIKGVSISFVNNEYEPYKEAQTLTASTPNGLHSVGDIKDEIDFARGVRVQRIGEVVLDGSGDEQWSEELYTVPVYSLTIPQMLAQKSGYEKPYVLCNQYEVNPQAVSWSTYNTTIVGRSGYSKISFINQNVRDLAEFKTLLAESPVTVLYALATPIETPLSAEELAAFAALHSNKPNTTVFNDGGAGLAVSYVADTKTYIDQKLAAISAAMLGA